MAGKLKKCCTERDIGAHCGSDHERTNHAYPGEPEDAQSRRDRGNIIFSAFDCGSSVAADFGA
jgi:hypothetical protein